MCIFKVDLRDKKRKKKDWGEYCKLMFFVKSCFDVDLVLVDFVNDWLY